MITNDEAEVHNGAHKTESRVRDVYIVANLLSAGREDSVIHVHHQVREEYDCEQQLYLYRSFLVLFGLCTTGPHHYCNNSVLILTYDYSEPTQRPRSPMEP